MHIYILKGDLSATNNRDTTGEYDCFDCNIYDDILLNVPVWKSSLKSDFKSDNFINFFVIVGGIVIAPDWRLKWSFW